MWRAKNNYFFFKPYRKPKWKSWLQLAWDKVTAAIFLSGRSTFFLLNERNVTHTLKYRKGIKTERNLKRARWVLMTMLFASHSSIYTHFIEKLSVCKFLFQPIELVVSLKTENQQSHNNTSQNTLQNEWDSWTWNERSIERTNERTNQMNTHKNYKWNAIFIRMTLLIFVIIYFLVFTRFLLYYLLLYLLLLVWLIVSLSLSLSLSLSFSFFYSWVLTSLCFFQFIVDKLI